MDTTNGIETRDAVEDNVSDIFQSPCCLVRCGEGGHLSVDEDTLRQLEALGTSCHVIAVVGPIRSGKSYLMNHLAKYASELIKSKDVKKGGVFSWMSGYPFGKTTDDQHEQGFVLEHTMSTRSNGIWIWGRKHPVLDNHALLLLDCDGLGDLRRGFPQYDNKILTLATSLSDILVYNTKGTVDEEAIDNLIIASRMSRKIQLPTPNPETPEANELKAPRLNVCLRDFSALLEDEDNPMSADKYLDSCLKLKPEKDEDDKIINRSRQCIRRHFSEKKAFTFDRPAGKVVLAKLDEVPFNKLSQDFLKDVHNFCSECFKMENKKLEELNLCSGKAFADSVCSYVKAVEHENFPYLNDTMTAISKSENERAMQAAVEKFRVQMEAVELPVFSPRQLLERKYQLQKDCTNALHKQLEYDDDNFIARKAEKAMETIAKHVEKTNCALIQELLSSKLHEMFEPIFYNIRQGKYYIPDGYSMYKSDSNGMIQRWSEDYSYIDQEERHSALSVFKSKLSKDADFILMEDQKRSAEQHQKALMAKDEECLRIRMETQEIFTRQIEEQQRRHDAEISRLEPSRKRKRDDDDDGFPNIIKRIFK